MPNSLPPQCRLRPAQQSDIWIIRKLVLGAKLDPTQLKWQQFWVIECEEKVVACGQLRSFENAQELGSLVVMPAWRGKGFGAVLTQHLIGQATQPLYLECMAWLSSFYSQFGFIEVSWDTLPNALKKKFFIGYLASKILPINVKIMKL
jgi:amino-acid N-acetyltransferase